MYKVAYSIRKCLEFIKEPVLAVLAALLVIQFVTAHTRIPSGSMIPTIQIGDHMLVNRIPYYYKDPTRGEIVIFKQDDINLVKRVVGMPGDEVDLIEEEVYINGEKLDESAYLPKGTITYPFDYSEVTFPLTVPEGEYFVMGDNRENSQDSRYFGTIQREVVFARGGFRIYPFSNIGVVK